MALERSSTVERVCACFGFCASQASDTSSMKLVRDFPLDPGRIGFDTGAICSALVALYLADWRCLPGAAAAFSC